MCCIPLQLGYGSAESFEVLAGDGRHDTLWVVDANGLKVCVPLSRASRVVPLEIESNMRPLGALPGHGPVIKRHHSSPGRTVPP